MKKFLLPGLVLYLLISGLGLFLGPGLSSPFLIPWATGYLLLVLALSYRSLFGKENFLTFEFLIVAIITLNFTIQLTGGSASPFQPLYFLIAAAAAFQRPLYSSSMVAAILAVEAGNRLVPGDNGHWQHYGVFAGSLAGLVYLLTPYIDRIRKHARMAQERYKKLLSHASAVDPLAGDHPIEAMSEQNRQAANISTAVEREGQFKGLIDLIYEMIPAHTYALFLAERDEDVFILRAVRSESRHLAPIGTARIIKGRGLIGIGIDKNQPQYLADTVIPARNLGYYTQDVPVRSLLAIPVAQDSRIAGVLVVDSLERDAFSPDNQDLLVRFAPFFSQIIEKIRISRELDLRARNFAALHEMSAVLSSSLEIKEILDRLSSQMKTTIPYDFCAFLHYDEKTMDMEIACVRGYDTRYIGTRFPVDQSAVISHMLKQWQDRSLAGVYYGGNLGSRGKDISLFPIKELQKPVQSLYGRPLIARSKFIGAVFLASVQPNAFSEYHRSFLDTLLNQAAMVVDNSFLHQNMKDMARTDGLTGLLNHRTFMEKLAEEYRRIGREERPFSILLMDIDRFKTVNDTYGHPVGDVAIKAVAKVLRETVRATDFVARYGGEEFAVGMVDSKSTGAEQMAERVRKTMAKTVITRIGGRDLSITLSIGVASFPEDTRNPAELLAAADAALYQAKRSGRNRVCLRKDIRNAEPAAERLRTTRP